MLKKQLLLTVIAFISFALQAQDNYFKQLNIQEMVRDDAGVLSKAQEMQLTQKLNQFNNQSSTQILVYTTKDLNGYDVGDFAQRLGEATQVGQEGKDNGIVIVVKEKTPESPGRVTIQTGYGIEALIPDATANQIVDNEMIPLFKQGDIYGGINKAVDVCISLTKGEFTADAYQQQHQGSSSGGALLVLIIFFITFFGIFGRARRGRYSNYGTRSNLPLWTALFLMGSGSGRGSGFGNFSSGSGSFGGGSGFGGFGGGSFGGGGASGSW